MAIRSFTDSTRHRSFLSLVVSEQTEQISSSVRLPQIEHSWTSVFTDFIASTNLSIFSSDSKARARASLSADLFPIEKGVWQILLLSFLLALDNNPSYRPGMFNPPVSLPISLEISSISFRASFTAATI